MSAMAAIPGGFLFFIVAVILMRSSQRPEALAVAVLMASMLPLYLVLLWGHYFARYPYKVIVEEGNGLWLFGGFTKLYVPLENIRDVRPYLGTAVRLKKRQRLLGEFIISSFFGKEADRLVEKIETEIRKKDSANTLLP